MQINREIQSDLSTERRQQAFGPFLLDDPAQHRHGQRFDVDHVGNAFVGHDRGRIGVDQDRTHALFCHRLAGLRAGVVELGRLADHDRPAANDQDGFRLLHVYRILSHYPPPSLPRRRESRFLAVCRTTGRSADQTEASAQRQCDKRAQQPRFALPADDIENATQRERQCRHAGNDAQRGADEQPASKVQSAFPSQRQLES